VSWTDIIEAECKRLYIDDGRSCAETAAALNKKFGTTFTRNAVIGKIHRRGWDRARSPVVNRANLRRNVWGTNAERMAGVDPRTVREAAAERGDKPKAPSVAKPKGNNPHGIGLKPGGTESRPLPAPTLNVVPSDPKVLADLPHGACKWPINDPGPGRMDEALFCAEAAERDAQGHPLPYCCGHRKAERDRSRKEHKRWRPASELARVVMRFYA
jgi:hypothetical protein